MAASSNATAFVGASHGSANGGGSSLSFLVFELLCAVALGASYGLLRRRRETLQRRQQQRYNRLSAAPSGGVLAFGAMPPAADGGASPTASGRQASDVEMRPMVAPATAARQSK